MVQGAAQSYGKIWVEVRDDQGVDSVWAIIYPPSYTQPDSSEEMIPEPEPVTLQAQGDDRYSATVDDFDESGTYRVVLYADDEDGLTSRPLEVTLELQLQTDYQLYLPTIIR